MKNKPFFKMLHPLHNIKGTVELSQSQTTPAVNKNSSVKNHSKASNPNNLNYESKILSAYLPFIYIARFIGICPIIISRTKRGQVTYNFKYISLSFLISLIGSLGIIAFYLFGIPQRRAGGGLQKTAHHNLTSEEPIGMIGIQNSSPKNSSALLELFGKILPLQMPTLVTVNVIAALGTTPKFARILQSWSHFEEEFQHQLESNKSPFGKLYRVRNRVALLYGTFALAYSGLLIYVTRPACDFTASGCALWERLMYASFVLPYISYTFLEDFKYLFMFKTVAEGFKQISCRIKEYNADMLLNSRNEEELYGDIARWNDLLNNVREQGRLVSECSSFHHIVSISSVFFSFVVCLYFSVAFQLNVAPAETGLAVVGVGFCLMGFLRLLTKVKGSESISHEEGKLVHHLGNVIVPNEDVKTHIKINSIIDRVERSPTQINVFNSFYINTSLLFKLLGQAATYLIFLIQFDNMLQADLQEG